jgi:hypothetical protein
MYIIIMTKDPLSFFLIFLYSEPLYSVDLKLTLQTLTYKTLIAKRARVVTLLASAITSPIMASYGTMTNLINPTSPLIPPLMISLISGGHSIKQRVNSGAPQLNPP